MDYWILAACYVVVLIWNIVRANREWDQTRRWMRTRVGPGLGLDPEQVEDMIEQYEKAETARKNFRAGQWEA